MLNTKHFILLAGDPGFWDNEMRQSANSISLLDIQKSQHQRGRRTGTLMRLDNGQWSVADISSLDESLYFVQPNDLETVLKEALEWVEEDPSNRELISRKDLWLTLEEGLTIALAKIAHHMAR
jgi:hypothetical protein